MNAHALQVSPGRSRLVQTRLWIRCSRSRAQHKGVTTWETHCKSQPQYIRILRVVGTLLTVCNQSNNHPVQIIEERKQIEPKFEKCLLLMSIYGSEYFRRVVHVVFIP